MRTRQDQIIDGYGKLLLLINCTMLVKIILKKIP